MSNNNDDSDDHDEHMQQSKQNDYDRNNRKNRFSTLFGGAHLDEGTDFELNVTSEDLAKCLQIRQDQKQAQASKESVL